VEEVISHAYTLEVSSPGLDRTLSREEHYRASLGKQLKIKLYQPIDNEKVYTGTIKDLKEGAVVLETGHGVVRTIPLSAIAKAHLMVVL
jgi:ribosome maturation factor RimP